MMTTGPALSSTTDWVWYVHDDTKNYPKEVYAARDYLIDNILPILISNDIPHAWHFDPVANTLNFVIPKIAVSSPIEVILSDAQFYTKQIPTEDFQSSQDLKEALLAGSNFSKEWH